MRTFKQYITEAKMTRDSMPKGIRVGLETYYIETAFDPVQSHVIKRIPKEDFDEVKQKLKDLGATRFRKIKGGMGFSSLAFKVK